MRRIINKIHSIAFETQMIFHWAARHQKERVVQRAVSISNRNLLQSSMSLFSDMTRDNIESNVKLHSKFDHNLWWKLNGDTVRLLLEGGNNKSYSSQVTLSKNSFERAYTTDAIYQDLFIDSPPCRRTVKLSFELINRFWEIKIIEWNHPCLMTTICNSRINHESDKKEEGSMIHQRSHCCKKHVKAESMGETENTTLFLRVYYTATQRPRFPFLGCLFMNFPSVLFLKGNMFEYKYSGWIDLYLRLPSLPAIVSSHQRKNDINDYNDCGNSWKIFRHDDRLRVNPPFFLSSYIEGINERTNRNVVFDALTIIENIPLISIIFHLFRRAHGITVQFFARRGVQERIDHE